MSDWTPKEVANAEEVSALEALEAPTSPVRLRRVPLPLEGAERFQWRLAAVLIALHACRGKSATVDQLHTLVWVINDPANADVVRLAWEGRKPSRRARGYVSGLMQTLRVAHAEGLVEQMANGRQKLSAAGIALVRKMRQEEISLGAGDELLTQLSPISSADMSRRLGGPVE
ncbi:hypothetical protein ACFVAJ_11115 [Agromyces sp. NPDC057679]|uniref:hypothetical protein n=1 Tax=Agromyces sp. NPDC057679 TaxID=3346207 RepID=UPI003671AAE8